MLVDDAHILRLLTFGDEVCRRVWGNRVVDLVELSKRNKGNDLGFLELKCTFVMMTSSSRGRSSFLIALPRTTSDIPFE